MSLWRSAARAAPALALFSALAATPLRAADFTTETWCEGEIALSNDDGTADLYEIRIWYDEGRYAIVSHDLATGEVIEDTGACDLATAEICKHYAPGDADRASDAFAFMLVPLEGGRFLYKEAWLDGTQGRGMVACFGAR